MATLLQFDEMSMMLESSDGHLSGNESTQVS